MKEKVQSLINQGYLFKIKATQILHQGFKTFNSDFLEGLASSQPTCWQIRFIIPVSYGETPEVSS
jgi:hypothetical protein